MIETVKDFDDMLEKSTLTLEDILKEHFQEMDKLDKPKFMHSFLGENLPDDELVVTDPLVTEDSL